MKKKALYILLAIILVACHKKGIPERTTGGTHSVNETGYASYYSDKLNGHPTASGELYNSSKLTAAHKKLAFGTIVKVTNLANGKSVNVRINDRGPYVSGRIIDLSKAAASSIGMLNAGIVKVSILYKR